MLKGHGSWRYQARRDLLARVAPVYQTASRARKHLILNDFVKATGYARHSAIRLLNHPPSDAQALRHARRPMYGQEVQQALFLAWKASHYVCAKRLLPSLPTLMEALEQWGHLRLTEEHRHQALAMSLSTAERLLRTQDAPGLHGLSTTTPGLLRKDQLSVRTFSRLSGRSTRLRRNGSRRSLWNSRGWQFSLYPDPDGSGHLLDRMYPTLIQER